MTTKYTEANVPTPALIIDAATVERNLKRMADYTAKHKLNLRPHTKTHKSIRMAKRQMELGAVGLTVAKCGEAQVMAQASDDLFVAYPALDPIRTSRLADLAKTKTVRIGIDSLYAADAIAAAAQSAGVTIGVLVDIDVGMHRTGVQTPEESLQLAQHIDRAHGLRLDGIMCFPGQIVGSPEQQVASQLQPVQDMLQSSIDLWKHHGLQAKIVSGGSTPTSYQCHHIPALTEIRPGTYIYYDWGCAYAGWVTLDDCAARILCTVISDAVPNKFVIDGGSKTFTNDQSKARPETGLAHIVEYPRTKIFRYSEEHGEVLLNDSDRKPKLGERVHVIPYHICPCVNLQDFYWLKHPDGSLEQLPVDARGKLS